MCAVPAIQQRDVNSSAMHKLYQERGLNSRQFKELLKKLESEYGDLVYYCEVRWLSRGNMLKRFYELRDEVKQFMETKGKPVTELSDSK